jgi:hypothetical protein
VKKPNPTAIQAATPLTALRPVPLDPRTCSVCGLSVDPDDLPCEAWREHDENDRPIQGNSALVFLGPGAAHAACRAVLDKHPRLYARDAGWPGAFPTLCGPCVHRDGLACRHPDLFANGGNGLHISLDALRAIVCSRGGGCHEPPKTVRACAGRVVRL